MKKLDGIEQKLDQHTDRFDRIDKRFDTIDKLLLIHSKAISPLQTDIEQVKKDVDIDKNNSERSWQIF